MMPHGTTSTWGLIWNNEVQQCTLVIERQFVYVCLCAQEAVFVLPR